ncbi:sterol desaturase family protein [uncultured Tenacibaculum sp.]|uniref:sterol desaturase family protein n=1 Tax=uncultured Tenacibaculum sp. TaxID=174713 RepID=UPI00260F3C11|nr:sterol desaturase family protein [uncultured Tenacibaculum sp.]
MSKTRLIIYSIVIIATIVGIPHYVADNFNIAEYTNETVDRFFYIFNDLSVLYIIVPFFVLELVRYLVTKRLNKDLALDSVANVLTVGFFTVINYILGFLFATKLYVWAWEYRFFDELPLTWVTITSCILLADFLYYWEHRLMHELAAGWVTHTVHHSSPHFNMSVAYRFGPLDGFFPLFFSVPAVMLGFNPFLMLAAELFVQTFQAVLHTEIIGKLFKPIEYIFNTPSHHRVHHGSNRQYWDKNYAGILIIWDRMLGTFEPEEEKVVYGISEPLNSVNPIKVFFHGITRFYDKLKHTKGVGNKLLSFVKRPHWMPKGQTYPPQQASDK